MDDGDLGTVSFSSEAYAFPESVVQSNGNTTIQTSMSTFYVAVERTSSSKQLVVDYVTRDVTAAQTATDLPSSIPQQHRPCHRLRVPPKYPRWLPPWQLVATVCKTQPTAKLASTVAGPCVWRAAERPWPATLTPIVSVVHVTMERVGRTRATPPLEANVSPAFSGDAKLLWAI